MGKVIFSKKPLAVNPLKKSPALGAAICSYGLKGVMTVIHGAQGCSAFAKNILIEHFKEPVPLTNTALQQIEVIYDGDNPVKLSIKNLLNSKESPQFIVFTTTGMTECRGDEIERYVKEFKVENPEFASFPIVTVSTPDFEGGMQKGFEKAMLSILSTLVKPSKTKNRNKITLLCGTSLTPGDIKEIKEFISLFGFEVVAFPDLEKSLIGKMYDGLYYPYTIDGLTKEEVENIGDSFLTVAVGSSTLSTAEFLKTRCNIPFEYFPSLSNYEEVDKLVDTLHSLKGLIPEKIIKDRDEMKDALADTHFFINGKSFSVAAIPDVAYSVSDLLNSCGGIITGVISPEYSPILEKIEAEEILIGDMEDFENLCLESSPHLILGSSHLHFVEEKLHIPLLRCDFPIFDRIGFVQKSRVCYRGIRDFLFEIANEILAAHIEKPYVREDWHENSNMQ